MSASQVARRAMLVSIGMIAFGGIWGLGDLADGELWSAIVSGGDWRGRLGLLRDGPGLTYGFWLGVAGIALLIPSSVAWTMLLRAEDEDYLYWWDMEERARARCRVEGQADSALAVTRAALAIEDSEGGRRPETLARYLDALGSVVSGVDVSLLPELGDYARRSQILVDRAVRQASRPDLARVDFAGRSYTALDLSGRLGQVRARIDALSGGGPDDLVSRTTSTPAPTRRG